MQQPDVQLRMPKPGKALLGVMVTVTVLWVVFAVGINWGGVSPAVLQYFVGSGAALRSGHLWVLVTAPLLHDPKEPGHLLVTLFGLYFLGTSLEDRWGARKMLAFLFGSAALAFALQSLVGALIPKLDAFMWYGGLGMVEAVAVAWALNNRTGQVRLFFVLPVSGTMLLIFIVGMSVLNVFANRAPSEGLVTPFGGMLAGWLFAEASPLRPLWLKLRLRRLQADTEALRRAQRRGGGPPLRVIRGGGEPPKDKRYLN